MLLLFVVLESPSRVTGMPPVKYLPDPCTGCIWAECVPEAADHPARIDGGRANTAEILFIAAA